MRLSFYIIIFLSVINFNISNTSAQTVLPPPLSTMESVMNVNSTNDMDQLPDSKNIIQAIQHHRYSKKNQQTHKTEKTQAGLKTQTTKNDISDEEIDTIVTIYFNQFLETSFIIEHGITSSANQFLAPRPRTIENDLLQKIWQIKENSQKLVTMFKNTFPNEFNKILFKMVYFRNIQADKEPVTQLNEYFVDNNSTFSINKDFCIDNKEPIIEILLKASLIDYDLFPACGNAQKGVEDTHKKINSLIECFEVGNAFLNAVSESQKNVKYFFVHGSFDEFSSNIEINSTTKMTYCKFLGGKWQLDPKNSEKMTSDSKVQILTPDNEIKTLNDIELTLLRNKLLMKW